MLAKNHLHGSNVINRMGLEQRYKSTTNRSLVPGPGTYEKNTFVGEGPKINIGAKIPIVGSKLNVPGPGCYNPAFEKTKKASQSIGIGYGGRSKSNEKKEKCPGPGSYSYHTLIDEGPKFG